MNEFERRLRNVSIANPLYPLCQDAADELAALRAQLAEAVGLLKRLSAEVFALNAFEHGVRFQIGNTNYAILTERAKDAREFIERVGK